MAYASWSVVFGEQPSAAKWNIIGTNMAGFNDGTAIGTDAIKSTNMFYGMMRNRQGGTTGDNTWQTTGTSTTATDAKDIFFQSGSVACTTGANTVTFPSAYNQVPLVFAQTSTAGTANVWTVVKSVTTTNFVIYQITSAGAGASTENSSWLAIGQ